MPALSTNSEPAENNQGVILLAQTNKIDSFQKKMAARMLPFGDPSAGRVPATK
jgi:hypothetical protein